MDYTIGNLSYVLPNKPTMYVFLLLLCSCAFHGATGINNTQFDLGATITRITCNDSGDIYVGGVNFVAQLSNDLDLLRFNLSIGPVHEPENCAPNPAPCDNTVMVLEIDKAHKMLLVCGSAYQGTCTLHSMYAIYDWYCLTGARNEGGADIVAGQKTQPVVVHFLPPTNLSVTPMIGIDMFPSECRAPDFGEMTFQSNHFSPEVARSRTPDVYPVGSRKKPRGNTHFADSRPKPRYPDSVPRFYDASGNAMSEIGGENDLNEEIEDPADFSTFASTLMIAGNVDNGNDTSTTPMLLSLRHLVFAGAESKISYAQGKDGKPVGMDIKPEMKSTFFIQYKYSFTWGQFSYFVMLRKGTCEGAKGVPCVVTKIGRTCNDPLSLLPYVEVPFDCEHNGKKFHLLTSATLSTVGLQTSESYVTVPILLAAFGNGSYPMSTTADPKYGGAVCVLPLDTFDNLLFQFAVDMCGKGIRIIQTAQWISGSTSHCVKDDNNKGTCTSETKNPYISVEDSSTPTRPFVLYLPDAAVAKVLTHTQTVQNGKDSVPAEKMTVYLLTSTGQIDKFTLRVKKDSAYRIGDTSEVMRYTDLEYTVSMQDTQPAGRIDQTRAVMYISKGNTILGLSLDFCRQYQTCSDCRERLSQCRWCPEENTCLDIDSAENKTKCPTASETTCPPRLDRFKPTSVPTQGGSMLTLFGVHLGVSGEGMVNVTVCNKTCDVVLANQNSITCKVRNRCSTCAEECNITVSVQGQAESHGFTSSYFLPHRPVLKYVTPRIESFFPKFGPVSGSTVLTFQGQHIKAGSNTKIEVAGADCVLGHSYSLECRIVKDRQRSTHCGRVVVSIDNFQRTLSEQFCFKPDPTIKDIVPKASIMSGGVTVTVTGSNLGSVESPRLILTLSQKVDDKSEAYNYISECTLIDLNTKMTCKTPDVTDVISLRREAGDKNNYITADLQIDMDGADAMATLPEPHQMRIHQDPALYPILAGSDDGHILSPDEVFTIRGQNIPTWIHWADIAVTIGNTSCPITAVTQDLISCDILNVLEMYKKDSLILENDNKRDDGSVKTTSTTVISDSNITQSTTEQANTTTASTTSRKVRHRREPPSLDMMLLSMILVPDNSSNVTYNSVNTTEGEMNFTTTTPLNFTTKTPSPVSVTTTEKTPDGQSRRKPLSYLVMARIGNYEATLGNVTVGPRNENETSPDPDTDPHSGKLDFKIIAGAGGAGFLVLILIVIACAMYCRAKKARALVKEQAFYMGSLSGSQHGSKEAATMSLKQILESVVEPHKRADLDKLIISLDRLTVGKSIGSGNFGCVYEGLLESKDDSPTVKVAVKTLQDPLSHNINLQDFVQEAVIMKDFRHPHVLGLVGLAEKEPGVPYVILPYMDSGDLLTYIRDSSVSLSLHDVIKFGADIASGMAYLSALKFVHRDLAARNCMLDSLHRVKVADFGLCRDIYEKGYYTSDNKKKLPIRWMAMESIEHGAYSTKSDAWSLGVVLWELLTRGVTPYPGVDGWDIINFLRFRRLAPPVFCPDELYNLMMQCWAKDPAIRPTFTVIQTELLNMIGQTPPAADTLIPTLKRGGGPHATSTQSISSNKSAEDKLSKQTSNAPKPLPRIQVPKQKSDEKPEVQPRRHLWKDSEKSGENKEEKDKEKEYSDTGVQSKQKVLKNVMITIPACYAHRDVSKTAAGAYIQLVDNYEPPPKFSHPLKRSRKKSSKKTSERQGADNRKGEQAPKTNPGGYSVPENSTPLRSSAGSYLTDNPDAGLRSSAGSLTGRVGRNDNYYVLERDSIRTSDTSDMDSRTSSMLCNTDSMPSLRDSHSHSRGSSTYSASGISNLSSLNTQRHSNTASHTGPMVHKKSPLAITTRKPAWEDVQEQSEGASEENHGLITSL